MPDRPPTILDVPQKVKNFWDYGENPEVYPIDTGRLRNVVELAPGYRGAVRPAPDLGQRRERARHEIRVTEHQGHRARRRQVPGRHGRHVLPGRRGQPGRVVRQVVQTQPAYSSPKRKLLLRQYLQETKAGFARAQFIIQLEHTKSRH